MLEIALNIFLALCGLTAYGCGVVWHLNAYRKKYCEVHWAHFLIAVFFWLSLLGYVVYYLYCILVGVQPESYIDF